MIEGMLVSVLAALFSLSTSWAIVCHDLDAGCRICVQEANLRSIGAARDLSTLYMLSANGKVCAWHDRRKTILREGSEDYFLCHDRSLSYMRCGRYVIAPAPEGLAFLPLTSESHAFVMTLPEFTIDCFSLSPDGATLAVLGVSESKDGAAAIPSVQLFVSVRPITFLTGMV